MKVYEMGSAYSDTVVQAYYGDDTPKEEIPHGELMNHDFQTGDLTGWTIVEGNTFTNDHVTNKNDWGWGVLSVRQQLRLTPINFIYGDFILITGRCGNGCVEICRLCPRRRWSN